METQYIGDDFVREKRAAVLKVLGVLCATLISRKARGVRKGDLFLADLRR